MIEEALMHDEGKHVGKNPSSPSFNYADGLWSGDHPPTSEEALQTHGDLGLQTMNERWEQGNTQIPHADCFGEIFNAQHECK